MPQNKAASRPGCRASAGSLFETKLGDLPVALTLAADRLQITVIDKPTPFHKADQRIVHLVA